MPRRTLSVRVPGWVIDDGSFPRATAGDVVEVLLEFHTSDDTSSLCEQQLTAIARPAYGRHRISSAPA
ncbi:hypothetical protein [Rhodococcus sp. 14-2470-1a]|uniref:hypothetical protein n=1 Tax=Rhodococcus sp. 14-2470-1a TaxID=2023150 RepID=UPI00117B4A96|nr:hypothetical protein [Rhodococcus sp. 14-2470-1a]